MLLAGRVIDVKLPGRFPDLAGNHAEGGQLLTCSTLLLWFFLVGLLFLVFFHFFSLVIYLLSVSLNQLDLFILLKEKRFQDHILRLDFVHVNFSRVTFGDVSLDAVLDCFDVSFNLVVEAA